jgi:CIC family chloride channel protein
VAAGQATFGFLLALLVAKTVAWCVVLAAGTPGGVLMPLLLLGGALGGLLAHLVGAALPGAADAGLWAVVSMAAVFAGATRAPLTALVLALELTHHSDALLPLLIACTVSELVSVCLLRHSLLTDPIARRGVPVGHEYELDLLSVYTVGQVMERAVQRVPAALPLGQLVALFTGREPGDRQQGYPVVDDEGGLVGMVTRADVPEFSARHALHWLLVADVMSGPPLVVAWPEEPLRDAAERMLTAGVGQLPVVLSEDRDCVVGILSRSDVLHVLTPCAEEKHLPKRWRGAAA